MTLRRILAALSMLCALYGALAAVPAHAQKTKAQLNSEIGVSFPDNTVGAITPQILRNVIGDVVNSTMPTAPVVSGNFPSFNGTTGLLKDSGQATTAVSVNAKNLGVKQDGIALTATVSITSGTGALTATGATLTAADVGKQIMVQDAGTPSTLTISSGSYNSGTGLVTLTMSAPIAFGPGTNVNVSSLTGTGGFASLNGVYVSTAAGTAGSTITYTAASGLGATTISGGSLLQSNYLTTTIATFTDATHVGLTANALTTLSARAENVTYGSDDSAAIASAVTSVLANNQTLVFTDGIVIHSGTINWAFNNLHVQFPSDNTVFIHTGTGIANSFSGILQYPATQGAAGGVFGGPGRPMLRGNPNGNSTVEAKFDNWHFGYFKAALRDATIGLQCRDGGIVNSSAVETTFDIRISNNTDGAFIIQPNSGVDCTKPVGSHFDKPIVEGTGAGSNKQWLFTGAIGNTIRGGTIESGSAGGIIEDSTSSRNTYIGLDVESNGTAADWTLNGTNSTLINSSGAGTTSGSTFGSTGITLFGGKFQSLTNNDNTLWSNATNFITAFTNNGTNTTVMNCTGAACPATALEAAATTLQNKIINTANAVTLKVNSKQVTDLSGSGSVLATTTSPVFVTPTLGAATATSINGTTITASAGGVLTLASAKTLTQNNTLTYAGTDGTTMTFPATSATIARTDAANTFTGTQTVTSALVAGTDGSIATIGPGGTGATSSFLKLLGANATAQGAVIKFSKNDAGTTDWFLGHLSRVEATGTSSDLEYFNVATSVRTMRLAIADDSVAFASTVNATSGTAGAINTLGGVGATKDVWAGANVIATGAHIAKGSAPVGTTGSCVASSFVGGTTAGKFSAAVCAGGTIILSGLPTAPNGYTCSAQDQTTPGDTLKQTANTTTSATFTATTVAADVVVFMCMAW